MAVRTNSGAVQGVLAAGGDYNGLTPLTPYIETATVVIDRLAAYAAEIETTVTDAELELLERWLAAWAYCMSDKPYSSRSTLGASGSFHGQTGKGLEANLYGQTAKRLDPTGYLIIWDTESRGARAGGFWLGTELE